MSSSLELPARPRRARSSRVRRIVLVVAAVALPVSWLVWYINTPPELSVSGEETSGTGVVGTPLYVGMYTAPSGFDRTLHISGVKVHTTASVELTVTPMLCRDGAIGVTTQPKEFCAQLVNPEDQEFDDGDSILVRIEATTATVAVVDRIRIGFRQDIRWATREAGIARAIITMHGRG